MRKIISFTLALLVCLSLCACAKEEQTDTATTLETTTKPQITQTYLNQDAVAAFLAFMAQNPDKSVGYTYGKYFDTGIDTTTLFAKASAEEIKFEVRYSLKASSLTIYYNTDIWLRGGESQQANSLYVTQKNGYSMGGTKNEASGYANINPIGFKADSDIEVLGWQPSDDISGEMNGITISTSSSDEPNEGFINTIKDGMNTFLEVFSNVLKDNNIGYTLADFGFDSYTIDANRTSTIKTDLLKQDPAPIRIELNKIEKTSTGTPKVFLSFTNTADKTVEALDFYIKFYNAYGEELKYGIKTHYHGAFVEPISSGATSPSNRYYTCYGFDTARSMKVAVVKYILNGEEAVTLREENYEWVEYKF